MKKVQSYMWSQEELRAWEDAHVSAGRLVACRDERSAARARLIGVRAIARHGGEKVDDETVF